jgi:hypothetical protein
MIKRRALSVTFLVFLGGVACQSSTAPGSAPPTDASLVDGTPASTPTCSSGETCAQYTAEGPGCLPSCTATAAENGAGPDAGGCANGSLCVETSGCCQGTGCSAISVTVCCPLVDGAPSCGDAVELFEPDASPTDAGGCAQILVCDPPGVWDPLECNCVIPSDASSCTGSVHCFPGYLWDSLTCQCLATVSNDAGDGAVANPEGGGVDAGPFACAGDDGTTIQCDGRTQICDLAVGGCYGCTHAPTCSPLPSACAANPTCACLATPADECSDNAGDITVTELVP